MGVWAARVLSLDTTELHLQRKQSKASLQTDSGSEVFLNGVVKCVCKHHVLALLLPSRLLAKW